MKLKKIIKYISVSLMIIFLVLTSVISVNNNIYKTEIKAKEYSFIITGNGDSSVDSIVPYELDKPKHKINATTTGDPDNVYLWYRWSTINNSFAGDNTIEIDSTAHHNETVATTQTTWNHTVGSGDDCVLVVMYGAENNPYTDASAISADFNGDPLTQADVAEGAYGFGCSASIWYLYNPDVGEHTITFNNSGTCTRKTYYSVSLFNVSQNDVPITATEIEQSATNLDTPITTARDNSMVLALSFEGDNSVVTSIGGGATQLFYHSSAGISSTVQGSYQMVPTAGETTMYTNGSKAGFRRAHVLVAFNCSSQGLNWTKWDDVSNPDTDSPWQWTFDFPQGQGYYEFYSIANKTGEADELPPASADAICNYTYTVHPPVISNPFPSNNSIYQSIQPTCAITVSDDDDDTMNVTFASNYTGSWVNYQTNSSVVDGTYRWVFTGANNLSTTYYWKVYCNDSIVNISSSIYHFTTTPYNNDSNYWNDSFNNPNDYVLSSSNIVLENGYFNTTTSETASGSLDIALMVANTGAPDPSMDVSFYDNFTRMGHNPTYVASTEADMSGYDVVVISQSITSSAVAWLKDDVVPILTLEGANNDEFSLASAGDSTGGTALCNIVNNTFYGTSEYETGNINLATGEGTAGYMNNIGGDVVNIITYTGALNGYSKLLVVDKGDELVDTSSATERRAFYGGDYGTILNDDAWNIVNRTLYWLTNSTTLLYDSTLISVNITKEVGASWDLLKVNVNNTDNSTFSILDDKGSIILSDLDGQNSDISSVTNETIRIKGDFNNSVSLMSWNVSWEEENNPPTVDFKYPTNGSTNIELTPITQVWANDTDAGDTLTVKFYDNTSSTTVSTVGESVGATYGEFSTRVPSQRKTFYAEGRHWVFFTNYTEDGENAIMSYTSSTDGKTWESLTKVSNMHDVSPYACIHYNGTHVHYVYKKGLYYYYMRGVPQSNGVINWGSSVDTEVVETSNTFDPVITCNSEGYCFIGGWRTGASWKEPLIWKNDWNNDSWTRDFETFLNSSLHEYFAIPVALDNGRVYSLYFRVDNDANANSDVVRGKLWNGSFKNEELISTSDIDTSYWNRISATSMNNEVHFVFLANNTYNITYVKGTIGDDDVGSWDSETYLYENAEGTSPVISIDEDTGDLYVFWSGKPKANCIYYMKYDNSTDTWDSDPTLLYNESTYGLARNDSVSCSRKVSSGYINIIYTANSSDPYIVRHISFDVNGGGTGWVLRQTNNTVSPGDIVYWNYTNADEVNTKYWWKVNVTDGNHSVEEIYHFTTASINAVPELSSPSVSPESGVASYTTFYFNITWSDADGEDPTDGYLKVNITRIGWSTNQSMIYVEGDNTTGANYTYSTTLTAGSYNYTFWASDGIGTNSSGPHSNPSVSAQSLSFTITTSSSGNFDFRDWTLSLTGVGLTTEYNVNEDNQTAVVPALNISNTGNVPLNFTMKWLSDPGSGIDIKYNISNNPPNPGTNNISIDPSSTQIITNLGVGAYEEIWLWMDFVAVQAQSSNQDIRITSSLYNG